MPKRFNLSGCVVLCVGLVLDARSSAAEIHELKPVLVRRTCNEGFVDGSQGGGYWSDRGRTSGNVTWLKFEVPKFPGQRIVEATLEIGPVAQFNHPWDAGIQVHYVKDDDWSAESIRPDWPTTDRRKQNRNAHDNGGATKGRVTTDITDWLSLDDEGQGKTLSVRLSHTGGGLRGWWSTQPTTLTLTTEKLITFGPPQRVPKGPGGLAVRSSLTTVFAEEAPDPDPSPILSLSAARRESESAQIVAIAGGEPVQITGVDVEALAAVDERTRGKGFQPAESKGKTGGYKPAPRRNIPAANVTTELVGYVTIRKNSWRGWKRTGLWPDVLMPIRPFDVPAGQCRLVWVTVRVPADAASGDYIGRVNVRYTDGRRVAVPLKLRVCDFTLPESPAMRTSYWTVMGTAYPGGLGNEEMARKLFDLFGAYRTSTDVWAGIRYYREPDGTITVDFDNTRRNIEYAAGTAGFNTLNISAGCWGAAPFQDPSIHDRQSGQLLSHEQRQQIRQKHDLMKMYLNQMCDWLQTKGWLDRAYMQLWDEAPRNTWAWGTRKAYPSVRAKEPRLRLLSVVGIHPDLQGMFDIWAPHLNHAFYDRETYQRVRQGIRLHGQKNFAAKVTASSTGGWGNAAFYKYQPIDAHDGCEYTKWIPKTKPTTDKPQWLQFEFEQPASIDGIRIVPHGSASADTRLTVEGVTEDGNLTVVKLKLREGMTNAWSFEPGKYKAVRLVLERSPIDSKATDKQPLPPDAWGSGVREVEFLRQGLAPESTLPRPQDQRPCETWEYNVGADWPSVCIDAAPHESRATGWLMWLRGSSGYLNYGAGQWKAASIDMKDALADPPPMIWRAKGNGGPNITWPSNEGPLASVRFARFRDGIDDHDYLTLLSKRDPEHPLLREVRRQGRSAAMSCKSMEDLRQRLADILENRERREQ